MAMPEAVIRRSYLEQARLSQAHRWLAAAIAGNAASTTLDELLAPDATLAWPLGTEPMPVDDLPALAGTVVRNAEAPEFPDPHSLLFRCTGLPSQLLQSAVPEQTAGTLRFLFAAGARLRPLIESVALETSHEEGGAGVATTDQRAASRILSLKHRWHALVENPERSAEPFEEIIAPEFVMDWGDGAVRSFEELAGWILNSASAVSAARHDIAAFDWAADGPHHYQARFLFEWSGLSRSGKPMAARSEHRWRIRERLKARYPAIVRMDVKLLVPFHRVEEADSHDRS